MKVQTDRFNEAIKYLKSKSITETIYLIRAASVWVVERIGLKKAEHRKKNEPRWKCRMEGDIKRLRQKINFLGRELKKERYRVKRKRLKTVIEELKQIMLAKSADVSIIKVK